MCLGDPRSTRHEGCRAEQSSALLPSGVGGVQSSGETELMPPVSTGWDRGKWDASRGRNKRAQLYIGCQHRGLRVRGIKLWSEGQVR